MVVKYFGLLQNIIIFTTKISRKLCNLTKNKNGC